MDNNSALIGQEAEPENNQMEEIQPVEKIVEAPEEPVEETAEAADASMESLLGDEDISLDFPKTGEIRQGIIATIRDSEVMVSIGTKSEGVISGRELEQIPDEERELLEVGQEIPVYVVAPEDSNGNVVLSYIRAREEQNWVDVERMLGTGEIHSSKVIGYNKGGLLVPIGSLRGFVPASQISLLRRSSASGDTPDQRYGRMVGEPMDVRVIEVDRERRRLILSERQALQETRESLKDRLLDELKEGAVRTGRVTSLADFGAFVNIEGADGLVHLSEISWDRIQHPNEVLKVGQEVDVKIISVDTDRKRIGLSIRQLQDDPWTQKVSIFREGMLVEGTITHLTKFGAFARIADDLEGLIHISELSEQRVAHPKEVLSEGDVVTLRVIRIDPERRRIGLSLRKVDSPAYADLDWKMALADEVAHVDEPSEAPAPEEAVEELEAEIIEELAAAEEETIEEALEQVIVEEAELVAELEAVEELEAEVEVIEELAAAEEEAIEDALEQVIVEGAELVAELEAVEELEAEAEVIEELAAAEVEAIEEALEQEIVEEAELVAELEAVEELEAEAEISEELAAAEEEAIEDALEQVIVEEAELVAELDAVAELEAEAEVIEELAAAEEEAIQEALERVIVEEAELVAELDAVAELEAEAEVIDELAAAEEEAIQEALEQVIVEEAELVAELEAVAEVEVEVEEPDAEDEEVVEESADEELPE